MPVIRFFWRVILQIFFSIVALVVGIAGIAATLCMLAVALTCALFLAWAGILLTMYLTMHNPQYETGAVHAIMISAVCFASLIVFWHFVGRLFIGPNQFQKPALYLLELDESFAEPVAATVSRRAPIWTDRRQT